LTDIIDTIDELVDWQLSQGPVDDYNTNRYDKCWHCGRQWHGIALTRRVAEMYAIGICDENYSTAADDSPVVCPGSNFIGPIPPPLETSVYPPPVGPHSSGASVELLSGGGGGGGGGGGYTLADLDALRFIQRRPYCEILDDSTLAVTAQLWITGDRRWWRRQLNRITGITIEFVAGGDVTITLNGQRLETLRPDVRVYFDDELVAPWCRPPTRDSVDVITIDVCQGTAPEVFGTWEPLTAPGVTAHPDDTSEARR
jgi:hypothetical protein